ncbi:diversity-generating retroelement protein bAvd family protein [Lewinellaceae bacterium SD302]|nr:diversity-generating retroelement protein bAvd family protein [Lewinellaceae bacterium SD302]
MPYSDFKGWQAYQLSYSLAEEVFNLSLHFPREEKYSLTDQIRRASRAVPANLAEGAAKRRYPKHFIAKLTDAAGENYETQVWLSFARTHKYISEERFQKCHDQSESIARLINYMIRNPSKFGCKAHPQKEL